MQRERFTVKYVAANNCFAYLPDAWLRGLETKANAIEILHGEKKYYVSCDWRPNSDGSLGLSATFARSLNISQGDQVFVTAIKNVPSLRNIAVAPRTIEDRQILELQMDRVQASLLNQIRIVSRGQPVVVWFSKFSSLTLYTESLEPNYNYGCLEQLTEVHVLDIPSNVPHNFTNSKPASNSLDNFPLVTALRNILPSRKEAAPEPEETRLARNKNLLQTFRSPKFAQRVHRVHFLPKFEASDECSRISTDFETILRCPFNVFVPQDRASDYSKLLKGGEVLWRLRKVPEDYQHAKVASVDYLRTNDFSVLRQPTEIAVRIFVLEDVLARCSSFAEIYRGCFDMKTVHDTIYVSESVGISLKLNPGSRVTLHPTTVGENSKPSYLEVFPWTSNINGEAFKRYVSKFSKSGGFVMNTGATVVLDDSNKCTLRLFPQTCSFVLVDQDLLERMDVRVKPVPNDLFVLNIAKNKESGLRKISRRHLEKLLSECQLTLNLSLGIRLEQNFDYDRENILVSGDLGCGKTTVCKILKEELKKAPYFVHTHWIDCRSLKGKKVEILQKVITTAMSECTYHQPSVLFLDDIESITNVSSNDEENTPDSTNAARITDMLINVITQYQELHYISVVASCSAVGKIGQRLRPARGSHFFRTVLTIPNLEKVDRIDILQLMLGDKLYVPGDVDWDYYGNKTEGWVVQDLVDLAEKATFAAWKRHVSQSLKTPVVITEEDMSWTLKNSTPMSLQGVQFYKGSGHLWSDIGGLKEVKQALTEILHWPLKYPEIFKNAPIKLQNGVLLYGMPGTGKTMLAKAISNECGVNLISVKGPELLSKYIGVSEESVRNVFERALRAKPCVLFFDEFDSLAPRRGHDNTGVTDRVVNQLLTQLDGVEDREGVAVVAASSRPDLLDPALLRPGRLDKCIHCPLPDKVDREDILSTLCRTQNINVEELDLKDLANQTSGFTGADLSAVITQARLCAFEDAMARTSDGKVQLDDVNVSQAHLVESVKSTHPSLSAAEKMKYTRIYARFSRNDNLTEEILRNQKATLA